MISDFVKGKKKFEYPKLVQKGISLHRFIDDFTDHHLATKEAKEIFRPHYRLYSGAFIDIAYDHFLATDKDEFTLTSLQDFSKSTYSSLEHYSFLFPDRFKRMFPYMKEQNWLYNYHTRWGMERSFEGLVRRGAYLEESATAFKLFEANYQLLQACYRQFWADVKPFTKNQLEILTESD